MSLCFETYSNNTLNNTEQIQIEKYYQKQQQKNKRRCTCEVGKLNVLGKKSLRYSMCDVCSEKIFSNKSN